ncbi:MAG: glycosyltransferase [Opitutales bacterium]|nr:glycosyltransferase [Opitutales bacterium]
MGFRLVRVARYYQKYAEELSKTKKYNDFGSYKEQLDCILSDCYHWSDFMSEALNELGLECHEIISNVQPLQQCWLKENSPTQKNHLNEQEIVLMQIRSLNPDILFLFDWSEKFGPEFVKTCRESCKNLKLVVGWCGEAHPTSTYFSQHDMVLSCAKDTVEYFVNHGLKSYQMHHAFSPKVLESIDATTNSTSKNGFGFIGSAIYGGNFHLSRAELFLKLSETFNFTIYGEISNITEDALDYGSPISQYLRKAYGVTGMLLAIIGLASLRNSLPAQKILKTYQKQKKYKPIFEALSHLAQPPVFGLEMYRKLSSFLVCLNAHGPSKFSSNMRMFEVTGIGTCLLTDSKPNLGELFEADHEVVTYSSEDECAEKIDYLSRYPEKALQIAEAGKRRVLKQHTFNNRASVFLEYLQKNIS